MIIIIYLNIIIIRDYHIYHCYLPVVIVIIAIIIIDDNDS